jgi:hypothetical protein
VARPCFKPNRQEQIQIIASAIGKPKTKAPAIARLNSVSKFASGRNMLFLRRAESKKPSPGRCGDGF